MPRTSPGFPSPLFGGQSGQLRSILGYVSKVDAAAYNNFIDMRKVIDAGLDQTADDLRTEMADADDELRQHLRYVLAGSSEDDEPSRNLLDRFLSDRLKGAILLGVGIVLATAGSIVGTLA